MAEGFIWFLTLVVVAVLVVNDDVGTEELDRWNMTFVGKIGNWVGQEVA